jgi:hypothetical protein
MFDSLERATSNMSVSWCKNNEENEQRPASSAQKAMMMDTESGDSVTRANLTQSTGISIDVLGMFLTVAPDDREQQLHLSFFPRSLALAHHPRYDSSSAPRRGS